MPVRTETHARNVVCVSTKRELQLSCGDVPHRRWIRIIGQSAERCAWSTFGREHCAIRTEGERCLRAGQPTYCDSFVTIKTPYHRILVSSLGREVCLIRTARDLTHRGSVASQDPESFAGCNLPHTHRVIVTHADKIIAVRAKHGTMHFRGMSVKLSH